MYTVTSDNGKEFAKHESIAKNLDAQFFFAHPYASWERGLNENTNGLIRKYFLKKTQFNHISDQQVQSVMEKLNNRPRKCLGMKTPNQLFLKDHSFVALRSWIRVELLFLVPTFSFSQCIRFLFRSCHFFRGLIVQIPRVDAHLVLISHLHSSAGLAPSQGHLMFPQGFVFLICHTCLYFRRKYHK